MKFPSFAEVTALFNDDVVMPEQPVLAPPPIPPHIKDDLVVRAVSAVASAVKNSVVRETEYHFHGQVVKVLSVRWGVVASLTTLGLSYWAGRTIRDRIREANEAAKNAKEETAKTIPLYVFRPDGAASHPESLVEGSPFKQGTSAIVPDGQISLGFEAPSENDGKTKVYFIVGAALRINNWVIFPTHSLISGKTMHLINQAKSTQDDFKSVSIDSEEIVSVCADLSAIKLNDEQFAKLSVRKVRLGKPTFGASAQTVSMVDYKYSTGTITRSQTKFGFVEYAGSTQPGFSGSALTVGSTAVAIHMHGGTVNGGLELAYILVVLRFLDKLYGHKIEATTPVGVLTPEARTAATEGSDYIPDNFAGALEATNLGKIDGKEYCAVRLDNGDYVLSQEERLQTIKALREKQRYGTADWADEVELEELEREARLPPQQQHVAPPQQPTQAPPPVPKHLSIPSVVPGFQVIPAIPKPVRKQQSSAPPVHGYPNGAQAPVQNFQAAPVAHYPPSGMIPPYPPQQMAPCPPPQMVPSLMQPVQGQYPCQYGYGSQYVPEALMTDAGATFSGEYQRPGVLANPGSVKSNARQGSQLLSAAKQQKRTERQKLMNYACNLSEAQLRTIHNLGTTGKLQEMAMSQQTQAQQQNGRLLIPSLQPQQASGSSSSSQH